MASKSVKIVLEGTPIESVIAESKLNATVEHIKNLPTGQSVEFPKVIIPEINANWSLKLTPISEGSMSLVYSNVSYRNFSMVFEIEAQSEAVWKSKQYQFEVKATQTLSCIRSQTSVISGMRVDIDQNVKKHEKFVELYTSSEIMPDGLIEIDITVSILHIKNLLHRNNFYDPVVSNKRIIENNLRMLEDTKYADFTFNVGDRKFKVHKTILAAASPVFDKTFTSAMVESHKNECIIDKIDPDIFEHLMRFIYGGKLPENLADVSIKLYEAAHYYQIEQLMEICEQEVAVKLDVSSAQEIYQWAHVYDIEQLKVAAWPIIKNEILKIYYPLKGEPLPPQMVQTLIAQMLQEAVFWEQFRN